MSKSKHAAGRFAPVWLLTAVFAAVPVNVFGQITEIKVTTRKREESLQDVPIAVSAISTEQIERQGLTELKKLVQNQPSVKFDQSFGPSDNRITIRGLSNTRGRSNVAFLVDGIDVTTENLIVAGSGLLANRRLLTDVQRVEIVKGPQSALFGRSAFAGALSYVTKEPTEELDGKINLDVGDYGKRTIEGAVGGPLTDTLGFRVSGTTWNEDGYYQNSVSGENVGGTDGYGTAATLVWKPTDLFKIKGRVEYSDESYDPRAVVNIQGTQAFLLPNSAKEIPRPVNTALLSGSVQPTQPIRLDGTPLPRDPSIVTGAPVTAAETQKQGSSGTNLFNFGTYCPGVTPYDPAVNITSPTNPAAFCLPRLISSAAGRKVTASENPRTGTDYPGTTTETFRASLQASMDLGYGLLTSYTGWTDFDSTDQYDQDHQAISRPDTLLGAQEANTIGATDQFSQEFRFQTQFDGPVNFTGGLLYWSEDRNLTDLNWITFCSPYGRNVAGSIQPLRDGNGNIVQLLDDGGSLLSVNDPTTGALSEVSGICDGTVGAGGYTTLTSYQAYRNLVDRPRLVDRNQNGIQDPGEQILNGQTAGHWGADTRHWSIYGVVEWKMTDDLVLTLEDRFVRERFRLVKPGSSNCTKSSFAQGSNPTSPWLDVPSNLGPFCDLEKVTYNILFLPATDPIGRDPTTNNFTWDLVEGSTTSSYNTPKITLDWSPWEGTKIYTYYAFAQKPGGINQLTGGGGAEPPGTDDERFDPEKMKAWEIGLKTGFELGGFWQVNTSGFLQDYTDKQVGIQVVSPDGISQPKVVNASGAQVWGFEFETLWQPAFMEGLTLGLAGTLLDATYTDWVDDTRNLVKAATYGDCPLVYKLGNVVSSNLADFTIVDTSGANFIDVNGNVETRDGVINDRDAQPTAFCRLNYAGNDLERTPDQAYSASASLQRPFMDTPFEYLVEVSGSYQSERWLDPENLTQLDENALMDVRIGLTSDRWDFIAYVDNVLDDDTFKTAGSGPDFGQQVTELGFTAGFGTTHYFATLPDPRVFGVRAAYRFGEGR